MIKCNNCGFENRPVALYCRDCGGLLKELIQKKAADPLEKVIGFDQIKDAIRAQGEIFKNINARKLNGKTIRVPFNMIITGDSGTGKSILTEAIAEYLFDIGVIKKKKPVVVDVETSKDDEIGEAWNNAKDGVLCIDGLHKIIPTNQDEYKKTVILKDLVDRIEDDASGEEGEPVIIFNAGNEWLAYMSCHPIYDRKFTFTFKLDSLSVEEYVEMCRRKLIDEFKVTWSDEALSKLKNVIKAMIRDTDNPFGYGHSIMKKSKQILMEFASSTPLSAQQIVKPEHIPGKEFIPKTFDEVMKEFDFYVGISEVKKALKEIAAKVETLRMQRGEDNTEPLLEDHFLFLGNPGTGKTTMARLYADALTAMGVLPVGQLVETGRKDIVVGYEGQTAPNVEKLFDKAEGGVLFIDEAYDLKNGDSDTFGQEAVNTLIKLAEDRRGRLVVILAGYTKEMLDFRAANRGIKSRFNNIVNFSDYDASELEEIFRRMVKRGGYILSDDAETRLPVFFNTMKERATNDFGNAREVRNAYEDAVKRQAVRISELRKSGDVEEILAKTMTMDDIEGEDAKPQSMEEIMKKLDDLVGMNSVKQQIMDIAYSIKAARIRAEDGGSSEKLKSIHIAFTGNPGTGKTTVAKRLGEVFKAMGVTNTSKVVIKDRGSLITKYVGSGGNNMNDAINEAMGGILFLDEAYTLYNSNGGFDDTAGKEAVEVLMRRMTEDAGKFITIIAGYKDRIENFIQTANDGLDSRFPYKLHIPDYSAEELTEIYLRNAQGDGFEVSEEAKEKVMNLFRYEVANKSKNFGNARLATNIFNRTVERLDKRVMSQFRETEVPKELLRKIEAEDVPEYTNQV